VSRACQACVECAQACVECATGMHANTRNRVLKNTFSLILVCRLSPLLLAFAQARRIVGEWEELDGTVRALEEQCSSLD